MRSVPSPYADARSAKMPELRRGHVAERDRDDGDGKAVLLLPVHVGAHPALEAARARVDRRGMNAGPRSSAARRARVSSAAAGAGWGIQCGASSTGG
jgi:hypothetical protein